MELRFTEYSDSSKNYTESEAVNVMDDGFANGKSFIGHWDNGYSYCGSDRLGYQSGAEVVASIKEMIAKKFPKTTPTDEQLCCYSGYQWCGITCDKQGRFRICMAVFTRRYSEISDS